MAYDDDNSERHGHRRDEDDFSGIHLSWGKLASALSIILVAGLGVALEVNTLRVEVSNLKTEHMELRQELRDSKGEMIGQKRFDQFALQINSRLDKIENKLDAHMEKSH